MSGQAGLLLDLQNHEHLTLKNWRIIISDSLILIGQFPILTTKLKEKRNQFIRLTEHMLLEITEKKHVFIPFIDCLVHKTHMPLGCFQWKKKIEYEFNPLVR